VDESNDVKGTVQCSSLSEGIATVFSKRKSFLSVVSLKRETRGDARAPTGVEIVKQSWRKQFFSATADESADLT